MPHKTHYKKIFVIATALFVLFIPATITVKNNTQRSLLSPTPAAAKQRQGLAENILPQQSPYSSFRLTFNLNLAEATSPTAVGASAGATNIVSPDLLSCAQNVATCGVYYVTLVVNGVMGLLLIGGAWLVKLGLQFNDNVFNSPAVQTGFSVSLAIANLGFVLGIIIIAIATIIRNQTYGIKQLLWKLVVMAILVNFGLVITAPIVGFANSMSNYFINATSPSTATGGYVMYVNTMMTAFQPQTPIENGSTGAVSSICSVLNYAGLPFSAICGIQSAITNTSSASDTLWQNTMALMFDVAFSGVAAFTFICLAILLIVRYLMLGGLLIVLPLAWLTYVFPKFDNSFSKWWNTFVKWTFFPPLALFFIYLAFITATSVGNTTNATSGTTNNTYLASALGGKNPGASDSLEQSLSKQTGLGGGVVEQAADEVLLVGLMIMGLMFALSLSGKAGSTVVNGATHASMAVAGYIGKRGLRVAGRSIPKSLKEGLQAGKVPLFPKRLQVAAGVRLGNLERVGRGDMVAEEAKNAEALAKDPQQFARIIAGKAGPLGTGATSKQRQMAMLAQFAKDEDLQKEVAKQGNIVGGKHIQEYLRDNESEFARLQQGKLYETLKDKSGLTPLELAQKSQDSEKTVLELGKKERLQEIKDIKAKAAANGGVYENETDASKVRAHEDRKEELEYVEKQAVGPKSDLMSAAERGELADIRTMEKTPGKYMTDEEKAKYQTAKDSYEETSAKLKAWVTKNPDTAADTFQDHDKALAKLRADGKPVPLTFDPAAVKRMQQSIITAMAEGFSPQNAKSLIEAIGKKNNLKFFEGAMESMDTKTTAQIKELATNNKALKTWIQNNPGRNIVDLNQMFGIRAKRKKGKEEDDEA